MKDHPTNLDPDHRSVGLRDERLGGGHLLHYKRHEEWRAIDWQDKLPLAGKAAPLRKVTRDQPILLCHIANPRPGQQALGHNPFAISLGPMAFDRSLTSSGHRRRPVGPSRTSMRETLLRLGTSIRCSFWCSIAKLLQTQLQGGMPEMALEADPKLVE